MAILLGFELSSVSVAHQSLLASRNKLLNVASMTSENYRVGHSKRIIFKLAAVGNKWSGGNGSGDSDCVLTLDLVRHGSVVSATTGVFRGSVHKTQLRNGGATPGNIERVRVAMEQSPCRSAWRHSPHAACRERREQTCVEFFVLTFGFTLTKFRWCKNWANVTRASAYRPFNVLGYSDGFLNGGVVYPELFQLCVIVLSIH